MHNIHFEVKILFNVQLDVNSSFFAGTSTSQLNNQAVLQNARLWTARRYTWFYVVFFFFFRFIRFWLQLLEVLHKRLCCIVFYISPFWLFHLLRCMRSGEQWKQWPPAEEDWVFSPVTKAQLSTRPQKGSVSAFRGRLKNSHVQVTELWRSDMYTSSP